MNVSGGSKDESVQSQKVIEQCKGFRVMIFTDGSVCGGIVGSGACAAVLVPISDNQEVQVRTSAVGCKVSSFECEVEGIILGVNMAIEHFHVSVPRTVVEEVYVFVIVRMQ